MQDMPVGEDASGRAQRLQRRLLRERRARLEAERLLVNRCGVLLRHNRGLEGMVDALHHDLVLFMLGNSCLESLTGSGLALWGLKSRSFRATEGFYRLFGLDPERDCLDETRFRALLPDSTRDWLDDIERTVVEEGGLDGVRCTLVAGALPQARRWRMAVAFLPGETGEGLMLSVHSPVAAGSELRA